MPTPTPDERTVPNFDFLAQPAALPRPAVTSAEAQAIALERFGVNGTPTELGSQQDRNFRIDAPSGRFVLKVANPVFAADEIAAQNIAMAVLHDRGVVGPRALPGLDGEDQQWVELDGRAHIVRLLTYVDGDPLTGEGELTDAQLRSLGDIAGRVAAGLAELEHPGTDRSTQWDLRIAGEVVEHLAVHIEQPARRRLVEQATWDALARLEPLRDSLRTAVIHGDVTDDNIVVDRDDADAPAGVIDFGDVSRGWIVAELAVAVASALHHVPAEPLRALEVIDAFAARMPLTDQEITALWPLVVLRAAVLVVSGEQQTAVDAGNTYADENRTHEWLVFAVARRIDPAEAESLIRWRLASGATESATPESARSGATVPAGRLFDVGFDAASIIDLSVTSHRLDEGRWLEPGIEAELLAATRDATGSAVTRYGEFRLTRAVPESAMPTPTFALAVSAHLPEGTTVRAPIAGMLTPSGNAWVLAGANLDVWFDGLTTTGPTARTVAAGDPIGVTETLVVQLSRVAGHRPPAFVRPGADDAWRALSPDPSPLFGIDLAAPRIDADAVLERRDATFARVQEHYYAHPPQIERGWRHHLIDTRGQTYVDLVNNVTAVGHAHPRLVDAVRNQWALLNTNSRFHYEELSGFTSRLAALAPDPLDTVFLVNSGSEAVDLAIRLAQTVTGKRTIMAVREAYHGWTVGADAVSSSIGDNPRALETRPDWVRLVESPHSYRGKYRGPGSASGYLADLAADLDDLDAAGTGLAGFIAEPVFGNAGGVMLPDGYLAGAYELVRRRGGVCIADEVQVGYGRLGSYFWGSEQQGVVPDIITVAKAMGNGHPLGAVITTREIADRFAAEGSFFSSAGGSPVSSRVGLTVLDIMRDEHLQHNARDVGAHLAARLEELATRFPLIGAVHGLGLYLGVELVSDPDTLEPAGGEAARICDALLAEGCIVQPTGDYKNVLKIKPPLCLTVEAADFFADALERVLSD